MGNPNISTRPVGRPRFAVLDVETTGLSPAAHRLIEVAVVRTDVEGRKLDEWATRINPEGPVGATFVHGISAGDVAGAPVFADIAEPLAKLLSGAAIVAHNAPFDLSFLVQEFRRAGWVWPKPPVLCTLAASEIYLPSLTRRRLGDCCDAVGVAPAHAHSALGDARATADLLAAYLGDARVLPRHVAMPDQALAVDWPTGPTLTPQPAPVGAIDPDMIDRTGRERVTASESLVSLIDSFSLKVALAEGAPAGALNYLEKVAESLADGELSSNESAALGDLASAMELTDEDIAAANRAFVLALAYEAVLDGKVSRQERAELNRVCELLQVNSRVMSVLLNQAEVAREVRLSTGLSPLPDGWSHGEPLRVGDTIAFTGCVAYDRTGLEDRATSAGVQVVGSVSAKVVFLVSDETMDGSKAARARDLGTRVIHPELLVTLLDHLQPALPRKPASLPTLTRRTSATTSPRAMAVDLPSGASSANVRSWGRANGWEVAERGRLSQELVAAYLAATGRS